MFLLRCQLSYVINTQHFLPFAMSLLHKGSFHAQKESIKVPLDLDRFLYEITRESWRQQHLNL